MTQKETIDVLKRIRENYPSDSQEYAALRSSIVAFDSLDYLDRVTKNLGLRGFEDVPQRYKILTVLQSRFRKMIDKCYERMGVQR